MYKLQMLNKISDAGLKHLPADNFTVTSESENPDGFLLRSFVMHETPLGDNLKAVARAGAGVNNIPVEKCSEAGIIVFNTPGANANAVKELVIAGLLMSSRKINAGINWTQSLTGDVAKLVEKGKGDFVGPEIMGKKIGVIGLGAIGVMVANVCNSLGMEVMGFDPFISVDAAWRLSRGVQKAANLDAIYAECDYITVHVPLGSSTKNMFNTETMAKLKPGVRILNFARGELVCNEAIKKAVESGTVSCYVTDFPTEDLLGVDGIITIPHLGASTPESEENCAEMAAKQIREYLLYGNIVNAVNLGDCELPYVGKKRVCVWHRNIPNIVGPVTTALAKNNINIADMLNKSKDKYSYMIIDVDSEDLTGIEADLIEIEGVIRVRII